MIAVVLVTDGLVSPQSTIHLFALNHIDNDVLGFQALYPLQNLACHQGTAVVFIQHQALYVAPVEAPVTAPLNTYWVVAVKLAPCQSTDGAYAELPHRVPLLEPEASLALFSNL